MKKICFLIFFMVSVDAKESEFLEGFILGQYDLIGKSIGGKDTYYGQVTIKSDEKGMQVTRTINGNTTQGHASIEQTKGEKVNVIRIRFEENDRKFEETCLVNSDLDNYARLTCHLYVPNETVTEPGLEALFIKQDD